MNEENDIDLFTEIESDVANKARKKALHRINTARAILGTFALIGAFTSLWLFAFLVALLIASFKWPFITLFIASTIFSISFLITLPKTYKNAITWEGVNFATHFGEISGSILVVFLIYLIIRGTITARKHGEFKK